MSNFSFHNATWPTLKRPKKWRTYYIFSLNKVVDPSFLPKVRVKIEETYIYILIDNIIVLVWCWDLFPELTSFLPGWSFVLQLFPANLPVKDGWSTRKNAFRKAGWQSDDVFVPWCSAGWKTYRTVESRQWKVIRLMFWDPVFSQKISRWSRHWNSPKTHQFGLELLRTSFKWMEMVFSNHFPCKDLVHHPMTRSPQCQLPLKEIHWP